MTGIDPIRLSEIDDWNGSMLVALTEAHRDKKNTTDQLLEVLIGQIRFLVRQTVVNSGGQDPGPLDLHPQPAAPVKTGGWRAAFNRSAQYLRDRR